MKRVVSRRKGITSGKRRIPARQGVDGVLMRRHAHLVLAENLFDLVRSWRMFESVEKTLQHRKYFSSVR
jgi:hypothetical protein